MVQCHAQKYSVNVRSNDLLLLWFSGCFSDKSAFSGQNRFNDGAAAGSVPIYQYKVSNSRIVGRNYSLKSELS